MACALHRVLSRGVLACSLVALAGLTSPVVAQATPAASTTPAAAWSDPEFATIAGLLTGSWKSSKPVAVGTQSFDILMNVAPVAISDVPDAMYAEIARSDAPDKPYRQAIWRLYRRQGQVRLQTLEFRRKGGEFGSIIGLWAAPEAFPKISMSDLVGTLDIALTKAGEGYTGKTPHAFPTAAGGATEMTSEISFDANAFTSADRGFDAAGSVVWGPAAGESYGFARVASPVTVTRGEGGLITLDFASESSLKGEPFAANSRLTVHYIGQLLDTGYVFDASYERGSPFTYAFGQDILQGWNIAMANARTGMKRRIVIPGPLGYGERGRRDAKIGSNATLVFAIDVLNVEKVEQPAVEVKPMEAKPVEAVPTEAKPAEAAPATQTKPQ